MPAFLFVIPLCLMTCFIRLWHQCPSFVHPTGQRLLRATSLPTAPVMKAATLNGTCFTPERVASTHDTHCCPLCVASAVLLAVGVLCCVCVADQHHFVCIDWRDGHHSAFHGDWLLQHEYSNTCPDVMARLPKEAYATAAPFHRRARPSLKSFAYHDVMHDTSMLLAWLECIVTYVPTLIWCTVHRISASVDCAAR